VSGGRVDLCCCGPLVVRQATGEGSGPGGLDRVAPAWSRRRPQSPSWGGLSSARIEPNGRALHERGAWRFSGLCVR
jgi:hypothetical protein